MLERIQLRYIHEGLHLGFVSIREAYLLAPNVTPLLIEVYRGGLVYRAKGSSKRISYRQIKKGLRKTSRYLEREVPDWLYELSPQMSPKKRNPHQT